MLLDWDAQDVGDCVEEIWLCHCHFSLPMRFKATCEDVMWIFSVWHWKPIHTCLSIPTYHHWNYVVWDSTLYCVLKSWVLIYQTWYHHWHHQCYVEELKQLKNQTPLRLVAKAWVRELISIIENFHFLPPLGGWLSYFGVFLIYAWHYCRQYCIQQIKHAITADNTAQPI